MDLRKILAFLQEILQKIREKTRKITKYLSESFSLLVHGEESWKNAVAIWGIGVMVLDVMILCNFNGYNISLISTLFHIMVIVYFGNYIHIIKKYYKPKKQKLTKEEKADIAKLRKINKNKDIMQKILLKKPIFKFSPENSIILLSVIFILEHLIRIRNIYS